MLFEFFIFFIGYNWSYSVDFHFVIQLLQLCYFDMMLSCAKKIKKNILPA